MRVILPTLLVLAACKGASDRGSLRLAPANGQSNVGVFQPLLILGDLSFPEDTSPPPLIKVIDLEEGGFVEGEMEHLEAGVGFVPTAPWIENHSYLWSIEQPLDEVRQPTVLLPEDLLGTNVFHTDNRLDVLAATLPPTGELCLITSRPLFASELTRLDLSVDGEPVISASSRVLPSDQLNTRPLSEEDNGLGALCLITQGSSPTVGGMLRIESPNQTTLLEIDDATAAALVRQLRRDTQP